VLELPVTVEGLVTVAAVVLVEVEGAVVRGAWEGLVASLLVLDVDDPVVVMGGGEVEVAVADVPGVGLLLALRLDELSLEGGTGGRLRIGVEVLVESWTISLPWTTMLSFDFFKSRVRVTDEAEGCDELNQSASAVCCEKGL
jgi:hypothetical protein